MIDLPGRPADYTKWDKIDMGVLISSGMDGGLVIDGAYFRGADGRSGELGFMHAPRGDGARHQIQDLVSLSGLAAHLERQGFGLPDIMGDGEPAVAVERSVDAWIARAAENSMYRSRRLIA